MSYGLYDGDIQFYRRTPFFNLELMKISSYYKRKREIVNLSPSFSPNMYKHFIVRQDLPLFNKNIIPADNVSFGGRAFDGKEYKPLPLEIEVMKPDVLLYDKISSKAIVKNVDRFVFSTMRRAEHLRISLDGKNIWDDFEKQLKKEKGGYGIIFHDYNLNDIEGSLDLVKTLLKDVFESSSARRVGMKFPVQINLEEDFFEWATLPPMGSFFFLQYNGWPSLEIVKSIKKVNPHSSSLKQTTINITKNQNYKTFIKTGIVELFERILDLRRERIGFPLIFDKDFFVDSRWSEVMSLIQAFNRHIIHNLTSNDYCLRVAPYESFYHYMKQMTKEHILYGSPLPKQKVQELFQFVRENNYNLFVDFYEYYGEKR